MVRTNDLRVCERRPGPFGNLRETTEHVGHVDTWISCVAVNNDNGTLDIVWVEALALAILGKVIDLRELSPLLVYIGIYTVSAEFWILGSFVTTDL